jgi:hypothetical protein
MPTRNKGSSQENVTSSTKLALAYGDSGLASAWLTAVEPKSGSLSSDVELYMPVSPRIATQNKMRHKSEVKISIYASVDISLYATIELISVREERIDCKKEQIHQIRKMLGSLLRIVFLILNVIIDMNDHVNVSIISSATTEAYQAHFLCMP